MKFFNVNFILVIILTVNYGCKHGETKQTSKENIRQLADTVGFARYSWQMDSLMARLDRKDWKKTVGLPWKLAICPHDDYTYVGSLYPEILQNIKAS